jgi:hypothetical protein
MAIKIAERGPSRADILFELIGDTLAKQKKSTILKVSDICKNLFVELEDNDLLEPSLESSTFNSKADEEKLKREAYEENIALL